MHISLEGKGCDTCALCGCLLSFYTILHGLAIQEFGRSGGQWHSLAYSQKTNAAVQTEQQGDFDLCCGLLVPLYAARATEEVFYGKRGVTLGTAQEVSSSAWPVHICKHLHLMSVTHEAVVCLVCQSCLLNTSGYHPLCCRNASLCAGSSLDSKPTDQRCQGGCNCFDGLALLATLQDFTLQHSVECLPKSLTVTMLLCANCASLPGQMHDAVC